MMGFDQDEAPVAAVGPSRHLGLEHAVRLENPAQVLAAQLEAIRRHPNPLGDDVQQLGPGGRFSRNRPITQAAVHPGRARLRIPSRRPRRLGSWNILAHRRHGTYPILLGKTKAGCILAGDCATRTKP